MSVTGYFGVMGSGKSYEVVSGPLLDAVTAGRRVVTNIDGISEERIHAYVHRKRGVALDRLGKILYVRTDDIKKDGFFPVEVEDGAGARVEPGVVQPGDLLIVDEAWKLWGVEEKLRKVDMAFFRMHRHFVHAETGVACDVVLMIQTVNDLHRSVRAVIELSFRMVKLKSLGISKGYRVEMYETARLTRGNRTGTFVRKYSAEIFPLYKSYAAGGGAGGKELNVDKRQNVLARPIVWFGAFVTLSVGVASVAFSIRFFHGGALKRDGDSTASSSVGASAHGSSSAGSSAAPASGSSGVIAGSARRDGVSGRWRVVGSYAAGGQYWVVVADESGRLRVQSPAAFVGSGIERVGEVDGERVAVWSGSVPGKAAGLAGVVR